MTGIALVSGGSRGIGAATVRRLVNMTALLAVDVASAREQMPAMPGRPL